MSQWQGEMSEAGRLASPFFKWEKTGDSERQNVQSVRLSVGDFSVCDLG